MVSKKQIFVVYAGNEPCMLTVSAVKVYRFIAQQILKGNFSYESTTMTRRQQVQHFKKDWSEKTRDEINSALIDGSYGYFYDGEEML